VWNDEGTTTVTLSWSITDILNSEYDTVELNGVDMMEQSSYQFSANHNQYYEFQIIAEVEFVEEILDVDQSVFDRGFPIRHALDGDWGAAQNFIPTMPYLSSVDIYLRKFGTPEFDLEIELREDAIDGQLLDTVVFPADYVQSSWEWLKVNFDDVEVIPGVDYFIVLPPAPGGVTTSFGYEWGYANGDQYDDGAFWFTRDGGGLWRDLPTRYEFTFRTYGYD
jgi:hypothetical protein